MNVSDIEKLVKLIEETKDEQIKTILRKLLGTWVEKEGMLQQFTPPFTTTTPLPLPKNPWEMTNSCPKCGLKLEGVMGYVCPNYPCPTGMGGTWCGVNE